MYLDIKQSLIRKRNISSPGSDNKKGNGYIYYLRRGNTFTLQRVTFIYAYSLFLLLLIRFLPRKCNSVVRKVTRDLFKEK